MPITPARRCGVDDCGDERRELLAPCRPGLLAHRLGNISGVTMPASTASSKSWHTYAMRSAHDTTSPSGVRRRAARPAVVADAVERLGAEVESSSTTSAPHTAWSYPSAEIGRQRVFAGMAAGTVAAVVAERDRLDERHVEPQRPPDARRDLRDLERVREPRALVIGGEDEDLRLAGQAAKGARVQDAITVALEAGAHRIGRLVDGTVAGAVRQGGALGQACLLVRFALGPRPGHAVSVRSSGRAVGSAAVPMCEFDIGCHAATVRTRTDINPDDLWRRASPHATVNHSPRSTCAGSTAPRAERITTQSGAQVDRGECR